MTCINEIRRFVYRQPAGKPFCTRELLIFGKRGSVDQVLHLMVKNGRIKRVARGVFVRNSGTDKRDPTILEIVEAKARAYDRTIAIHSLDAAVQFKLRDFGNQEATFACSGRPLSFTTSLPACPRVYLEATSFKDLRHGDEPAGLVIRALKSLGETRVTIDIVESMMSNFSKEQKKEIALAIPDMPAWMADYFAPTYPVKKRTVKTKQVEIRISVEDTIGWKIEKGLLNEHGKPWPDDDDLGKYDD